MFQKNNPDAACMHVQFLRTYSKQRTESQKGSQQVIFLVGNYRLRRAERWENIPRVSSEIEEI